MKRVMHKTLWAVGSAIGVAGLIVVCIVDNYEANKKARLMKEAAGE